MKEEREIGQRKRKWRKYGSAETTFSAKSFCPKLRRFEIVYLWSVSLESYKKFFSTRVYHKIEDRHTPDYFRASGILIGEIPITLRKDNRSVCNHMDGMSSMFDYGLITLLFPAEVIGKAVVQSFY